MSALPRRRVEALRPAKSNRSLLDDIGNLQRDFGRVKDELRRAHAEIARLEELVAHAGPALPGDLGLADLRRQVSFYCHPDRGGDVTLMQRLNALFDRLEK